MDPNLNYSDPGLKMVLSFDNVGFRFENSGLVYFKNSSPFFYFDTNTLIVCSKKRHSLPMYYAYKVADFMINLTNDEHSIYKFLSQHILGGILPPQ
jgi:hypothetical protein